MLRKETVEKNTFEILIQLMNDKKLKSFNLVGGTSLSLQIGHRKSIDLDLFSHIPFSVSELKKYLAENYNLKISRENEQNTLITQINNVKVDFILYEYPLLQDIKEVENIRLYSLEDITAMKLSAIADSGTRLKDFVDVACLSTHFSLNEMLNLFGQKFPNTSKMHALRGLAYHDDIDFSEQIMMMNSKFDWRVTEKRIREMSKNPDKIFPAYPEVSKRNRGLNM